MPAIPEGSVPVVLPTQTAVYHADVPLRGPDFGKWSDVPQLLRLVGTGEVLNFGLRLRPFGGHGAFKGVHVIARMGAPTCQDGRIIVSAGSDPEYDYAIRLGALAAGDFDHRHLSLAVLSKLDFSRLAPCDLDLTLVSPIGVGASLGTSAAVSVGILRAFLGAGHPAAEIARMAIDAESRLAGRNTGNQDQIASAFGSALRPSACQYITLRNLYDFEVQQPRLGPRIRSLFTTAVAVYIGYHDSSNIHRELIEELSSDEDTARRKILAIRECAGMAERSLLNDDPRAYREACDRLLTAQRDLSPRLVNDVALQLMETASACTRGGESAAFCVPGAGGQGGTLILHLPNQETVQGFAKQFSTTSDFSGCRLFEICLANDPPTA